MAHAAGMERGKGLAALRIWLRLPCCKILVHCILSATIMLPAQRKLWGVTITWRKILG